MAAKSGVNERKKLFNLVIAPLALLFERYKTYINNLEKDGVITKEEKKELIKRIDDDEHKFTEYYLKPIYKEKNPTSTDNLAKAFMHGKYLLDQFRMEIEKNLYQLLTNTINRRKVCKEIKKKEECKSPCQWNRKLFQSSCDYKFQGTAASPGIAPPIWEAYDLPLGKIANFESSGNESQDLFNYIVLSTSSIFNKYETYINQLEINGILLPEEKNEILKKIGMYAKNFFNNFLNSIIIDGIFKYKNSNIKLQDAGTWAQAFLYADYLINQFQKEIYEFLYRILNNTPRRREVCKKSKNALQCKSPCKWNKGYFTSSCDYNEKLQKAPCPFPKWLSSESSCDYKSPLLPSTPPIWAAYANIHEPGSVGDILSDFEEYDDKFKIRNYLHGTV
jgi:hypothetical protein